METRLQLYSNYIRDIVSSWNRYLIPKDSITIINNDTAAYHYEEETIICDLRKLTDDNLDELILRSFIPNHPRLHHYYGTVISEMWMITEAITSKTLKDAVNSIKIDQKTAWKILIQVAEGMQHLHNHGIIHRNLNLESVFFRYRNRGYEALIGNFSRAAKIINDTSIFSAESTITNEVSVENALQSFPMDQSSIDKLKASDMWNFGTLIWQCLHDGQMPVSTSSLDDFSMDLPVSIKSILADCWNETPHERPCFNDTFMNRLHAVSFEESTITSGWNYCVIA